MMHLTLRNTKEKTVSWVLTLCLLGLLFRPLYGEGSRQVAPTPDDQVLLLTNRTDFDNFAAFDGPADSRLYISVANASEIIYLGLSQEYDDLGNPFADLASGSYQFRIRRRNPAGNDPVVHGPFTIDQNRQNIASWSEAFWGDGGYDTSLTAPNPARGNREDFVYRFAPGQAGAYYIEFADIGFDVTSEDDNEKVLIGFWDFTVVQNGEAQRGRVWSRQWALRTPIQSVDNPDPIECGWDRRFNGALYSYTTDGFVSKVDFSESGFQGLGFTIALNSHGPGDSGNLISDRRSIPGRNATGNSAEHQIFLHPPDPLLFASGCCGDVRTDSVFRCRPGMEGFGLDVTATRPGQLEVILDFNRNGVFDPNSEDVDLFRVFDRSDFRSDTTDTVNFFDCHADIEATAAIPWDGLKGDGTPVSAGDTINLILIYTQGVQHWAVYDGEFLKNGFCVEVVRPHCRQDDQVIAGLDHLYWDDRLIPENPGTGQPKTKIEGCRCGQNNCRTWNFFDPNQECNLNTLQDDRTVGYGDKSTLNTWWFANIVRKRMAITAPLSCRIVGVDSICQGMTAEFGARLDGGRPIAYEWKGPGGFTADSASTGPIRTPGIYTVRITDEAGCTITCQRELTLRDNPIELRAGPDTALCVSQPVRLKATANVENLSYTWFNSPALSDTISTESRLTVIPPSGMTATYYVLAEAPDGCTALDSVRITVSRIAKEQPPDTVITCAGEAAALNPGGNPDFSYSWEPTTGLDLSNPARPVATALQSTNYMLTIEDSASRCKAVHTIHLKVIPPPSLTLEGDTALCMPEEITLTASADVAVDIEWYDNPVLRGDPVQTGPELTFTPSVGTITHYLRATTLEGGCETEDSASVAVKDAFADLGMEGIPDTSLRVCANAATTLSLPAGYAYAWSPVDDGIDVTEPAEPVFRPEDSRIYRGAVTDTATGCSMAFTVDILVNPQLELVAATDDTVCTAAPLSLDAKTAVPARLEWSAGSAFDSVLAIGPELIITPTLGTTQYYIRATDTTSLGCSAVDSLSVYYYPVDAALEPVVSCRPADTLALEVIDRSIEGQELSYFWFPPEALFSDPAAGPTALVDPAATEDFSVDLRNSFGCTATLETTARVIDLQNTVEVIADPDTIVAGGLSQLEVRGCTNCSYRWLPQNGTLNQPDIPNPAAMPEQTTTYEVALAKEGCEETFELTVLVLPLACGPPHVYLPNTFTPNNDGMNDDLFVRGKNIEAMQLLVFNRWGQKVFESHSQDRGWDGTFEGQQLPPDVYGVYLEVTCDNEEIYRLQGNVTLLR